MTQRFLGKFDSRLLGLKIVFVAIWAIFLGRLGWLQLIDHRRFLDAAIGQQSLNIEIQAKRGTIYDRQGRILAEDIDSYSYYVVPNKIQDKAQAIRIIDDIAGNKKWAQKFANHSKFLWVARKTDANLQYRLQASGLETLNRVIEPKRTYPAGFLALALLGRVDVDNIGLSGIEKYYDEILSGQNGKAILLRDARGRSYQFSEKPVSKPVNGQSIVLTIDLDLQQITEQELAAAMLENYSKYGMAVFQKVGTGEILACASLDSLGEPSSRNRPITDQYEPGSTFKLVAVAAALGSGRFDPSTVINVENGKFKVGGKIIRDDHAHDRLSVEEIVVFSSNIGAAKLGLAMGDEQLYKHIKESGFAIPLGIDFPGEAAGQLMNLGWRDHYLANVSFGHGIAASPLQMVSLYGAIACGGDLYRPFFAKEIIHEDQTREPLNEIQKLRNIAPPGISRALCGFLRQVVVRGTATKADSGVVTIAGKTGTALKVRKDKRGYDHGKSRASFVGFFPAEMPQVAGIVVFDEPKKSRYGGEVSAPVFRRVAERYSVLPSKLAAMFACGGIIEKRDLKAMPEIKNESAKAMFAGAIRAQETDEENGLPDFRGLTVRRAMVVARDLGLECEFEGSGVVVDQAPPAGELYQPGMVIKLRCTSG